MNNIEQLFRNIKEDQDFKNIVALHPEVAKAYDNLETRDKVFHTFHALRVNLDDQFFLSPLLASSVMVQLLENPFSLPGTITELYKTWGTRGRTDFEKWGLKV